MHGLHFFLERRRDAAVAAYEKAVDVIRRDKLTNSVSFANHHDAALLALFAEESQKHKIQVPKTFGKRSRPISSPVRERRKWRNACRWP